jgi:TPR repeat protein
MHEKGQGSGCDINEAIEWYTLSAKQGDRDALVALRRLSLIKNKSLLASIQTDGKSLFFFVCITANTF